MDFIDIDDQRQETEFDPSSPFVYQTMVCKGFSPIDTDRYVCLLEEAYCRVFNETIHLDPASVGDGVRRRLAREGYHENAMNFISVRVYDGMEVRLVPCGTSMYESWGLRALRPSAIAFMDACFPELEYSSLCLSCASFMNMSAARNGARVGIALDSRGKVLGVGHRPLVAVIDGNVIVQKCPSGVEMRLFAEAVRHTGRIARSGDLNHEDLRQADELMYIDHEGLTSISSCDGVYYSDVIADSVGRRLGELFMDL